MGKVNVHLPQEAKIRQIPTVTDGITLKVSSRKEITEKEIEIMELLLNKRLFHRIIRIMAKNG